MSENKIVIAILIITVIASGTAYLKYGNDSIIDIMTKGCQDRGMVLYRPDMVEVLQEDADFRCVDY